MAAPKALLVLLAVFLLATLALTSSQETAAQEMKLDGSNAGENPAGLFPTAKPEEEAENKQVNPRCCGQTTCFCPRCCDLGVDTRPCCARCCAAFPAPGGRKPEPHN